jgi:8-oxo-dGTP diphosphatase
MKMARAPVLAAGGIVLRPAKPPLIALVRLRKRNEWVLPKGKLDDGETPREAAIREVWEETGHHVCVHEFLGTLAYDSGGRAKIVHYWRMETDGGPTRDLMADVKAVDWLPLNAALARLSRDHERAFLANVGPLALQSAKRSRERRSEPAGKRRRLGVAKARPPVLQAPAPSPDEAMAAIDISPGFEWSPLCDRETAEPPQSTHINWLQKARGWLRRMGHFLSSPRTRGLIRRGLD